MSHDEQLANLLAELADRARQGELVDIDAVAREHAALGAELRELWGAVMLVDAVGSDSRHREFSPNGEATFSSPAASSSRAALSAAVELPCQFGDYELLRELGRGGMGIVYLARQVSLNREVAVKMMLRGEFASPEERRRLRAEAEAAARLHHPAIVPVYEVGEHEGRAYFSMKYVEGDTLGQLLADGPLPARESAQLLEQVARAIHFAHEAGVLHRDLKPSNILIDDAGLPHVTDFGLAKQAADPHSLTRSGAILGTPAYMAPEQAAGQRGQVGPASDVYSLGCILYHLLTGRPPFQAASPVDTVLMVLEQDPAPPRLVNPKADRDLEMIALRCLQKPADLRYDSAEALANDLAAYLNDEPIAARSGRFSQIVARVFRETHHATVLENWGLLWMWHSLAILLLCLATNGLELLGDENRLHYFLLWTFGLGAWAAVFWQLRQRVGPVTFVERQIAHVWAASMISIAMLFPIEWLLNLPVLKLSPVVGIVSGMAFVVKAGILSGQFYFAAAALFAASAAMAVWPEVAHTIYGVVAALCFFIPGWKYWRQKQNR